jgi:hypothetical protein
MSTAPAAAGSSAAKQECLECRTVLLGLRFSYVDKGETQGPFCQSCLLKRIVELTGEPHTLLDVVDKLIECKDRRKELLAELARLSAARAKLLESLKTARDAADKTQSELCQLDHDIDAVQYRLGKLDAAAVVERASD